uniref:Uncharacterized protein n=1 Tax=Parascaris univalens TaxID=6257 RepID=A0A915AR98_PARUN
VVAGLNFLQREIMNKWSPSCNRVFSLLLNAKPSSSLEDCSLFVSSMVSAYSASVYNFMHNKPLRESKVSSLYCLLAYPSTYSNSYRCYTLFFSSRSLYRKHHSPRWQHLPGTSSKPKFSVQVSTRLNCPIPQSLLRRLCGHHLRPKNECTAIGVAFKTTDITKLLETTYVLFSVNQNNYNW